MANARPMVEFRDVCKSFGDRAILDRMSFRVERGEIFTIIGYSGTGKSVTLQNMTGLLIPERGTIYIDGAQIVGMDETELEETRRKFGYLFQAGALINWLTVAENVDLPLREHTSLSKKARQEVIRNKLKLVNMENDGDKYPSEISGGMRKRAALARAIALEPEIILFDEPTSGLDPVISRTIDELIKNLNRVLKITCIVVTHDMETAYGISDRIAFFYKGGMHLIATPQEIKLTPDEAVRHFISGGKEGRLTQKSMTAIIRSQPNLDEDESSSEPTTDPILAGIEERMRQTIKETRRLTKEDLKPSKGDKGRSSVLKAVHARTEAEVASEMATEMASEETSQKTPAETPSEAPPSATESSQPQDETTHPSDQQAPAASAADQAATSSKKASS